MATRRLRPEDWAPVPQTRIQIRAQQSPREARDERVLIAKSAQNASRLPPICYPPRESPLIPAGRESLDTDSPRAPEIVDFAAPSTGTWPRRGGPPSHIVYQQQQWGPRRIGSPGSVSQYSSSRQSEMSFGILDYYTRDESPAPSETLPPTPKVPQGMVSGPGCPKIGTPIIDPAMDKFDFGLGFEGERARGSQIGGYKGNAFEPVSVADASKASATQPSQQQETQATISTPPPPPLPKSDKVDNVSASKPTYSLFPKDTTPPPRPSITIASRQDSASIPEDTTVSHTQPDPSYRPRKESLTSSLRSRKDSFTSYRHNSAQRIPLRVFSASSNSNSSVYTTPRTSKAIAPGSNILTSSSTTTTASPPDSAGTSKSQSRWSDDTIASPSPTVLTFPIQLDQTPPSSSNRRTSFGSLLRGVEEDGRLSSGGQYPACFFEDDDDEVVPLRRKLVFGRGGGSVEKRAKDWEQEREGRGGRRGKSGWRKWLLCGCAG